MDISYEIERLILFGYHKDLITTGDIVPIRNALLAFFKIKEPFSGTAAREYLITADVILELLLDYIFENNIISEGDSTYQRELAAAQIMGFLTPRQSEVIHTFNYKYSVSPQNATEYLYTLSKNISYVKIDKALKNRSWVASVPYGKLELTYSLSDNTLVDTQTTVREISTYPKCRLCLENVGFHGSQNRRVIPLRLNDEEWFLDYSPYISYNEHCYIINKYHKPLELHEKTFASMLSFINKFSHYMIGANTGFEHGHFQSGHHSFPIEYASTLAVFQHNAFPYVNARIIKWPISTIRLESENKKQLADAASYLLDAWQNYSDIQTGIFPKSKEGKTCHNTIISVARRSKIGTYEMDIFLVNRFFQPLENVHHIFEKELDLNNCMGLLVLPLKLKKVTKEIAKILSGERDYRNLSNLENYREWIKYLTNEYGIDSSNALAHEILEQELGILFANVLESCGVYKLSTDGIANFKKFLAGLGFIEEVI